MSATASIGEKNPKNEKCREEEEEERVVMRCGFDDSGLKETIKEKVFN